MPAPRCPPHTHSPVPTGRRAGARRACCRRRRAPVRPHTVVRLSAPAEGLGAPPLAPTALSLPGRRVCSQVLLLSARGPWELLAEGWPWAFWTAGCRPPFTWDACTLLWPAWGRGPLKRTVTH